MTLYVRRHLLSLCYGFGVAGFFCKHSPSDGNTTRHCPRRNRLHCAEFSNQHCSPESRKARCHCGRADPYSNTLASKPKSPQEPPPISNRSEGPTASLKKLCPPSSAYGLGFSDPSQFLSRRPFSTLPKQRRSDKEDVKSNRRRP